MVWAIVALAIVVLGLAAWAGTGKLGEMPAEAVNDRPKAYLPDGPIDVAFVREARFPSASPGYDKAQVMEHLNDIARGVPVDVPVFDVVASGYDMQAVDEVLDRPRPEAHEMLAQEYFEEIGDEEAAADAEQASEEIALDEPAVLTEADPAAEAPEPDGPVEGTPRGSMV